jgi:hypothetical protein
MESISRLLERLTFRRLIDGKAKEMLESGKAKVRSFTFC